MFALPGGFVGHDESPEQTAERKLREKTGVGSVHLEQLRTYADPRRDPRGWLPSIAYMALVAPEALPEEGPEGREASWHPVDDLPELALDHELIVDDGLWRLRARVADKTWFVRVGGGLLPERFTLGQAQRLYEALSGETGRPGELPPRRQGHRPARRHRRAALGGPGPAGPRVPSCLARVLIEVHDDSQLLLVPVEDDGLRLVADIVGRRQISVRHQSAKARLDLLVPARLSHLPSLPARAQHETHGLCRSRDNSVPTRRSPRTVGLSCARRPR